MIYVSKTPDPKTGERKKMEAVKCIQIPTALLMNGHLTPWKEVFNEVPKWIKLMSQQKLLRFTRYPDEDSFRFYWVNGSLTEEIRPGDYLCFTRWDDEAVWIEQGETFDSHWIPEGKEKINLTFGAALEALKQGKRICRKGWNGKGMFLFLLPANDNIPTSVITDPNLRKVIEDQTGANTFDAYGSIRMWTADRKVLTGWLASQTDMLSEDWEIL